MKNFVKDFLNFNNTLANLKETEYKNSLASAALMEILIAKGLIDKDELSRKILEIDCAGLAEIVLNRKIKPDGKTPATVCDRSRVAAKYLQTSLKF